VPKKRSDDRSTARQIATGDCYSAYDKASGQRRRNRKKLAARGNPPILPTVAQNSPIAYCRDWQVDPKPVKGLSICSWCKLAID
jgi:hypothetical protein